jgi:YHS domain-containing protein
MRSYSRIGVASVLAFAGTVGSRALAEGPANTANVAASITSVSTGETYSLKSAMGRYVAVHFLPGTGSASDAATDADFVKSYVRAGATMAGVRELFVIEAGPEQARQWAAQLGNATPDLYFDSSGALAGELQLSSGGPLLVPATIVFDQKGSELFRQIGAGRHEHLSFGAFDERFTKATEASALGEYNLAKGERLAVQGYDVVAYFAENKAVRGKPALTSTYRGVRYQFASEENRAAFAQDPEKYVPTYGGWCASAMGAKGTKVEIDPTNFKVENGRLFLFYKDFFSDALKDWNRHEKEWEPAADANWKKLSGEEAHVPAK